MSKKETKAEVELPEETITNEAVNEETTTEPTVELTAEEQLAADLAQEKDKFLRLFAVSLPSVLSLSLGEGLSFKFE